MGDDPENLHQRRLTARRSRAFVRATRACTDPDWQRTIDLPLQALGERAGPVRDLDVLLEHLGEELKTIDEADRIGAQALLDRLRADRD